MLGLIATADVAKGEKLAAKCASCHTFTADGKNKVGPGLYGVIGRVSGTHADFTYSEPMKAHAKPWTFADLSHFIARPKDFIPGTKMTFPGLPNVQDRADLLAWLNNAVRQPGAAADAGRDRRRAGRAQDIDPAHPKSSLMDEIEKLQQQAVATKNEIVRANLRLVVSIAKRHVTPDQNFFELVSDGNMSLMRAVEKFDFARGNKFSTYASWAIMKNFARTIPDEFKHRDRFRTSQDELFAATQEHRGNPLVEEGAAVTREAQIERILRRLDEREQKIIISRFGLDHAHEPQTSRKWARSWA